MFSKEQHATDWANMCQGWAEAATYTATMLNEGLINDWKLNAQQRIDYKLPPKPKPGLHMLKGCDWKKAYQDDWDSLTYGTPLRNDWVIETEYPVDENTWTLESQKVLPQPKTLINGIDVAVDFWFIANAGDRNPVGTKVEVKGIGELEKFSYDSPFSPVIRYRAVDDAARLYWMMEARRLGRR
jgi:hypothetical protein